MSRAVSAPSVWGTGAGAGKAYLVGCGIGDPELLTLKAYRVLQEADIVLYDFLVSDDVLSLIRPDCEKICVGKQKNRHTLAQDEINALMAELVNGGRKVARLKSGDPCVFGRGAEEALYLIEHGCEVEIVSGITSAFAAPICAGIPLTSRGYSTSFSVVTAHGESGKFNGEWIEFLKRRSHTTVVLMGLSAAPLICSEALKMGIDPQLPAAIVVNGSRPDQQVHITTLDRLDETAAALHGAAVIVFGEVVMLSERLLPAIIQI